MLMPGTCIENAFEVCNFKMQSSPCTPEVPPAALACVCGGNGAAGRPCARLVRAVSWRLRVVGQGRGGARESSVTPLWMLVSLC